MISNALRDNRPLDLSNPSIDNFSIEDVWAIAAQPLLCIEVVRIPWDSVVLGMRR